MNLSSNITATAVSFSTTVFRSKSARFIMAIAVSFSGVGALAQTPSFSSGTDEIKYLNSQLSLAEQASDSGDFSQSISILKAAIAVDSTRDLLWAKLADSYRLSGDYANAISSYQRAIALKPTEAAFHNNLGDAYTKAQRIDDALSEYAIATQVDTQGAAIYVFNMGAVLTNSRRAQEAVSAFDLVIELDPTKADAYYQKGINLLGFSTLEGNRMISPRGTRAALEKYLALSPVGNYAEFAKKVLGSGGIESDSSIPNQNAFTEAFRLAHPFNARREYKAGMDAEVTELARRGISTSWAQKASSFWSDPIVASALQQQLARERQTHEQASLGQATNPTDTPKFINGRELAAQLCNEGNAEACEAQRQDEERRLSNERTSDSNGSTLLRALQAVAGDSDTNAIVNTGNQQAAQIRAIGAANDVARQRAAQARVAAQQAATQAAQAQLEQAQARQQQQQTADAQQAAQQAQQGPAVRDSELIRTSSSPNVYVVQGGQRHLIPDPATLQAKWGGSMVYTVSQSTIDGIPLGNPIPAVAASNFCSPPTSTQQPPPHKDAVWGPWQFLGSTGAAVSVTRVDSKTLSWEFFNARPDKITSLNFTYSYVDADSGQNSTQKDVVPVALNPGDALGGWTAYTANTRDNVYIQITQMSCQ